MFGVGFDVEVIRYIINYYIDMVICICFVRFVFRIRISRYRVRVEGCVLGIGFLGFRFGFL